MREVVASAAEAELVAIFHNGKGANPLRITLQELGHKQPPTPIQTDNSTTTGIANDSIKQKRSKAIDMRFSWIRDHVRQGQFHIFWKRGIQNRANYFTKHHPACHHQDIHSSYLYEPTDRSKNYSECLQEQDSDMTTNPSSKVTGNSPKADTKAVPDQGEGVLISNIRVPPNIVRDPTVTS
jgi:hypothetical protein